MGTGLVVHITKSAGFQKQESWQNVTKLKMQIGTCI